MNFNPRPRAGGDQEIGVSLRKHVISIHAPAQGATCPAFRLALPAADFNPRPRAGGDCIFILVSPLRLISIPAPAQGATARPRITSATGYFNPRPRAGGDAPRPAPPPPWAHFNPRPRAGGDSKTSLHSHVHLIIFTQITPFPCIFLFGIIQIHAKTSFSIGANTAVFS